MSTRRTGRRWRRRDRQYRSAERGVEDEKRTWVKSTGQRNPLDGPA